MTSITQLSRSRKPPPLVAILSRSVSWGDSIRMASTAASQASTFRAHSPSALSWVVLSSSNCTTSPTVTTTRQPASRRTMSTTMGRPPSLGAQRSSPVSDVTTPLGVLLSSSSRANTCSATEVMPAILASDVYAGRPGRCLQASTRTGGCATARGAPFPRGVPLIAILESLSTPRGVALVKVPHPLGQTASVGRIYVRTGGAGASSWPRVPLLHFCQRSRRATL